MKGLEKNMKNRLKLVVIGLLLLCIVAVPLFGVYFYTSPKLYSQSPSDYYVTPGILLDDALVTNRQFGGGTSVYLSLDTDKEATEEALNTTAEILKARFTAMGYSDTDTAVDDGMIRLDLSQKTYINSVIDQFGSIGAWSLVGSDMTEVLCDGSMISDASAVANTSGSYSITVTFTEEGAKKFSNNTASYAYSSSYMYFMMDGQLLNFATVSSSEVKETFTFGTFDLSSAIMYATIIKEGTLPGALTIERAEPLAPTFSKNVITACVVASVLVLLILFAVLILRGRLCGVFAILVLIADIAVLLTANLNATFTLHLGSLIGILLMLAGSAAISYFAMSPLKSLSKENNKISTAIVSQIGKFNLKVILIHAILLTLSIVGRFFAQGLLLSIAQAGLVFTCSNFIFHFVFLFFPIHTVSEMQK